MKLILLNKIIVWFKTYGVLVLVMVVMFVILYVLVFVLGIQPSFVPGHNTT